MASLIDNLVDILNSENEIYQQVLKLSKDKTEIIVSGDVKSLERITDEEKNFTDQIQKLEKNREEIMNGIGLVVKIPRSELTITGIIGILASEPVQQERLQTAQSGIQNTVNELRNINIRNKQLIEHTLEMIQFDLNLFKSLRQAPETANYNKSAYNTGDLLGNAGFDAKQ